MKFAMVLVCALGAFHHSTSAPSAVVESQVYSNLESKPDMAVIVSFRGKPVDDIVAEYNSKFTVQQRIADFQVLPSALQANAAESQSRVLSLLKAKNADFFQLWMTNQLVLNNPDVATINLLKSFPEVASIEADREIALVDPVSRSTEDPVPFQSGPQWGVADVGAPQVWEAGIDGKGVVVGIVDTGVRREHDILRSNFRSDYGWLDAVSGRANPYDDDGHGTHVAGTIAGSNGYGVAPGSNWIACKGLGATGGRSSWLQKCLQFMYCPTDARGRNQDCTKRAKVVNNSWGSGGGNREFDRTINVMQSNGLIVIFANGNDGRRGCNTVGSPADLESTIGVGALDRDNNVASFSSRGPTRTNVLKPEISAPGQDIRSASHRSNSQYVSLSGTSMAAPHVAGVAALYAQQNGDITHDDFKKAITGAAKEVKTSGETCGNTRDSQKPNNIFGYGKIDATALLE